MPNAKQAPAHAALIRRYDVAGTRFFLDPPYRGYEGDYGPGVFERGDFESLAEQLAGIAGRFILTINGTPCARDVFGRFEVEVVDTTYSIGVSAAGTGKISDGIHRSWLSSGLASKQ